jgi:hypothetical protein
MLVWIVVALFLVIVAPVVVRGAPFADDFANCSATARSGIAATMAGSLDRLGASRKAHLLEVGLTGAVCGHAPFGVAIAVPLALTIAVAFLLRRLLLDLGASSTWASIGGATWLLAPLGTESALWPAALHVPLGIALAILAVRWHREGRSVPAAIAVAGAGLSVEQTLLALPLAVWMLTPADRRRRSALEAAAVVAVLVAAFLAWPGNDPRLQTTLGERLAGVVDDPLFPILFVAVGIGLQSIPLALQWAFPVGVLFVLAAAAAGWRLGPRLGTGQIPGDTPKDAVVRPATVALGAAALLVALNVPVVLNLPHEGSPRLFAPSWLVLAGALALVGTRIRPKSLRVWAALGGAFAAGAVLSLALSVWIRVESANFVAEAAPRVVVGLPSGSTIALCGVTRTVVRPAPRGAFALHEFDYDWAARDAVEFYTGKRMVFRISGTIPPRRCPDARGGDRVIRFPELVAGWRSGG